MMIPSLDIMGEALRYPSPDSRDTLRRRLEEVAQESVRADLCAFLGEIECLTLEEWEELYVRSFDLDPDAAPYLGWHVWPDEQRRAQLLLEMARRLSAHDLDADGELPDHLVPVFRYLARRPDASGRETTVSGTETPLLDQALKPALHAITDRLRSQTPPNPYVHLLEGAAKALDLAEEGRPA